MAIIPELAQKIEGKVAAVKKNEFRRPSSSINKFLGDFSGDLAQVEDDKDPMVAAGFPYETMAENRAILEMLTLAAGERLGSVPTSPEKRAEFDKQAAIAEYDRRKLGVVASHVVTVTGDKEAAKSYRAIAKGSGLIDTLVDNIGLVAILRRFPDVAAQVRPGGQVLDAAYLEAVSKRSLEMLQARGFVINRGVPENAAVDRQNRLLTLAMNAQSEIKKFANVAFFDRPDYYSTHYASDYSKPAATLPAAEPAATGA